MDNTLLNRAKAAGLIPAHADLPEATGRPWPVVVFSALGAWLAAIPLLGLVGFVLVLSLGDRLLESGPSLYIVGALALVGAVTILAAKDQPLFVEQLALPTLLVGQLCIGLALWRDAPAMLTAVLLAALNLALAWWIPAHWLRVLLGMGSAAALLAALNLSAGSQYSDAWLWQYDPQWRLGSVYLALAAWIGLLAVQARGANGRLAAYLEPLICGWSVVLFFGWAVLAGPSLLPGGIGFLAELQHEFARHGLVGGTQARGISVVAACAATVVLAQRWPQMRASAQPWGAGVALVLLVLAAYAPTLGGILLATALLATSARWTLASTGVATAVWAIGSFYYQLAWPLADKALLLSGLGATLAVLTLLARTARQRPAVAATPPKFIPPRTLTLAPLAVAATLLVANIGIWQKEQTIRHGQPVFVKLVPVDPRSLMQGDYMRLNFDLPPELRWGSGQTSHQRPTVWLQPDPDLPGAYTAVAAEGHSPGQGLAVQLTPKQGTWLLVTDAWYFKEGEAAKFANARYGEFRVMPSGVAVLVGLADAKLQAIR